MNSKAASTENTVRSKKRTNPKFTSDLIRQNEMLCREIQ